MKLSTKITAWFSANFAILVVVVLATTWMQAQHVRSADARKESYRFLLEIHELLAAIQDTQRTERGYVLTGTPQFLQAYMQSLEHLETELANWNRLVGERPQFSVEMKQVEELSHQAVDWFQMVVALRENEGLDAAIEAIRRGDGELRLKRFTELLSKVRSQEVTGLLQHDADVLLWEKLCTILNVVACGAAFGLALGGARVIHRETQLRAKAEDELREMNSALEQRVQERTQDLMTANAQLAESESRFRGLAEGMPHLVWETDAQGMNIYQSPAWYQYVGQDPGGSGGWNWLQFYHPDDRDHVSAEWAEAIRAGGAQGFDVEARIRRHDGAYRWFRIQGAPVRNETGEILRWAGTCTDIDERKRAIVELRDRETLLRTAIEVSGLTCYEWFPTSGEVNFDARGRVIWGLLSDAPASYDLCIAHIHPDDRDEVVEKVRQSLDPQGTGIFEAEYRIRGIEDHVERWMAARGQTFFEDGRPVRNVGTGLEITQRKRDEQALRQSEERFRTMADSTPVMVWMADIEKQCIFFNKIWLQFTGRKLEDEQGNGWVQGVHPEDVQRCLGYYGSAFDRHEPFEMEYRLRHHSGEYRWIWDSGVPRFNSDGTFLGYIGGCVDIHDRKQTEEALRKSEASYRRLIETTHEGVWIVDLEGMTTYVNPQMATLLGYEPADMLGRHFLDFVFPEDLPRARETFASRLESSSGRQLECRYRCRDGAALWALVSSSHIRDEQNNVTAILRLFADITYRKQAEEQLQDLIATLERKVHLRTRELNRRNRQLRRLAIELSAAEQRERKRLALALHDHVQQILVAARFRLDRLSTSGKPPDLPTTLQKINDLIQEAISASRNLTMELSPPVLYDLGLTAALNWLARYFGEKYGLVVKVQADPTAEPSDANVQAFLFQCARELLFNVVKHAKTQEARIMLELKDRSLVHLTVSDQGVGCLPDLILSSAETATGVGLFSMQQRLEFLGGKMTVEAFPGKGCAVALSIPLDPPSAPLASGDGQLDEPADRPEVEPSAPQTRRIRVLLADDHRMFRETLAFVLGEAPDIEIVGEAENGKVAQELARTLKPEVILMDVSMPVVNGTEATRAIRQELPGVRIIGLSMHEAADLARAMLDAGAESYVIKSGTVNNLIQAIRHGSPKPPLSQATA